MPSPSQFDLKLLDLLPSSDIFNRTKDKKINEVINALSEAKTKFEFWIITKHEVKKKKRKEEVKYIGVDELNEKIKLYLT